MENQIPSEIVTAFAESIRNGNTPITDTPKQTANRSDTITKLAVALTAVQAALKSVPKAKTNPFYKSKYADLDGIWDVCREPLTKNGLSVTQFAGAKGQIVTVTTMLLHVSGEYLMSDLTLTAGENRPQAIGSAITYARRYAMSAMLGVSAEDDDDANTAQGNKEVSGKPEVKMPQAKSEQAGTPATMPLNAAKTPTVDSGQAKEGKDTPKLNKPQITALQKALKNRDIPEIELTDHFTVTKIADIAHADFKDALQYIADYKKD